MEYHVIHAFTDKLFSGNPAGVCLPDTWPADSLMQSIAAENYLSETAFLVKKDGSYGLRWFTPTMEIDLCGHATLASAFVLFDGKEKDAREIKFNTLSGELTVTKNGDLLCLNLPASPPLECTVYPSIERAFGIKPVKVYKSIDIMVLVKNEETLRRLNPVFSMLNNLKNEAGFTHDKFGVIVTAPGTDCDFVSRYFAPDVGVPEDPVTGRAHCTLTPYWSKQLGKRIMDARQLSARGGVLQCEDNGKRVKISGKAVRYLKGEIAVY
jgi:PhzF family phenazine biosynthesis protein